MGKGLEEIGAQRARRQYLVVEPAEIAVELLVGDSEVEEKSRGEARESTRVGGGRGKEGDACK